MQEAENCELYAIAGRDEKKVNDFKQEFGFKKVQNGIAQIGNTAADGYGLYDVAEVGQEGGEAASVDDAVDGNSHNGADRKKERALWNAFEYRSRLLVIGAG